MEGEFKEFKEYAYVGKERKHNGYGTNLYTCKK
jgi:hypothetical protein